MTHLRRIVYLLLAGSLLFTAACGGSGDGEASGRPGEGRYVETDVTPPIEGRFASFLATDGTIVCFDEGLKTRFESRDGGKNWSESPGPGSDTDRYRSTQAGTLLPDGSLLVFIQGQGLVKIAPDGGSENYPVSEIDKAIAGGENVSISLLQALNKNRLILSYMIGGMTMQTTQSRSPVGGNAPVTTGERDEDPSDRPDTQGGPDAQGGPSTQGGPDAQGGPSTQGGGPSTQGGDPSTQGVGPSTQGVGPSTQGVGPSTQGGDSSTQSGPQRGTTGGPAGGTYSGTTVMQLRPTTVLLDLSTGQVIADLQIENAAAATSDDSSLYIIDNNGKVTSFNLDDGSPSGKPDVKFGSSEAVFGMGAIGMRMGAAGGSLLALSKDGGIYSVQDGSLLVSDANGTVSTVLERTAYSIGAPRSNVSSIFALDDGSILVNLLGSNQTSRLLRYTWDENATVNPDKILTVWMLEDNNFVRAAIAEIMKKHPDAYITCEVAIDGNSAVSISDAIKTLNTRLLSGNGPDIILLDGCSADTYVGKGMLLDMSRLINTGDVFSNLLEPYTKDGRLYCLPTQFLAPMLMGGADSLNKVKTLDDLVSLVVNGNDLPAGGPGPGPFTAVAEEDRAELYFTDIKELCDILWLSCAPDIVSDNKLNTEALYNYLTAARSISDKYALMEQTQGERMGLRVGFFDGGVSTALPGSLVRYTMQVTNYAAFSAGNLQLIQMMMERAGSTLALFPGLTPGVWQPSTVVGINADTKKPEFAAELVQAMLSVDVQQLNYGTGLPVTVAGLAAQIDAINERRLENDLEPFAFDPNVLIDQLRIPSMGDTVLTGMMWSSVEKCCAGEIDVEGAVREIEQNIKNYLAERAQ